jgi:hypothetical protein
MRGCPDVDDPDPMSSLAYPREAAPRRVRGRGRGLPAVLTRSGTDVLLVVAIGALAVMLLAGLVGDFSVDSWLELVTGRAVWQHGIPHHETLTVISLGHSWIDQQWLSQLASYALFLVGGLGLLGLVNVALMLTAVGGATLASRRLGAPARSVLLVMAVCLVAIAPSREVRTQAFVLPLYVLVVWLIASDCRSPSRRVLWCLPVLALWANLHGSVVLGAALVALRGLTLGWERRAELRHNALAWRRPLGMALGAGIAILLTPYGLSIISYYRTTLTSSTLPHFVSEWAPVTSTPTTAVAVLAVAAVALWSFSRNPANTATWEKLALLGVCAMTIAVVRNAVFFGLLAIVVVPRSLGWASPAAPAAGPHRRRALINGLLVLGTAAAALVAGAVTLARPDAKVQGAFLAPKLLTTVHDATRADPSLHVLAQGEYSDWLLWQDPALSGRIADDMRFELLTTAQMSALNDAYSASGTAWMRGARGYRLLVLDRAVGRNSIPAFEHQPGSRVLYRGPEAAVILRTAAASRT